MLVSLDSTDPRFKSLAFHDGLNILVAERTEESSQQNTRNSTGKTSAVALIRYLLGGNLIDDLKVPELESHIFTMEVRFPPDLNQIATLRRPVKPQSRIDVLNWPPGTFSPNMKIADYRKLIGSNLFGLPDGGSGNLTSSSLLGRLIRSEFDSPVRVFSRDSDWIAGLKNGYFLGLDQGALTPAAEVGKLEKRKEALAGAIKEGALQALNEDRPALLAQMSRARSDRSRMAEAFERFEVEPQYEITQERATALTLAIRSLNDEDAILARRESNITETLSRESVRLDSLNTQRIRRLFGELEEFFPTAIEHRFKDAEEFHTSVIRNRKLGLSTELREIQERRQQIRTARTRLDAERSGMLRLLRASTSFTSMAEAAGELGRLDGEIEDLRRRLNLLDEVGDIDNQIRDSTVRAKTSASNELRAKEEYLLDGPVAMFRELGSEIYSTLDSSLQYKATERGAFVLNPRIDSDGSEGVGDVAIFLTDMVLAIHAMELDRAPRLLVHDSSLFDAIDGRQIASCLNIGSRLAEEYNFQYIVTMNSDTLVRATSESAFDPKPYVLGTKLTDRSDSGGLFGFRFASKSKKRR